MLFNTKFRRVNTAATVQVMLAKLFWKQGSQSTLAFQHNAQKTEYSCHRTNQLGKPHLETKEVIKHFLTNKMLGRLLQLKAKAVHLIVNHLSVCHIHLPACL